MAAEDLVSDGVFAAFFRSRKVGCAFLYEFTVFQINSFFDEFYHFGG